MKFVAAAFLLLLITGANFACPYVGTVHGRLTKNIGLTMFIGVYNAQLVLSDGSVERTALTNPFGYYQFDNVTACGNTYTLTAEHRHYEFVETVFTLPYPINDGDRFDVQIDLVALRRRRAPGR